MKFAKLLPLAIFLPSTLLANAVPIKVSNPTLINLIKTDAKKGWAVYNFCEEAGASEDECVALLGGLSSELVIDSVERCATKFDASNPYKKSRQTSFKPGVAHLEAGRRWHREYRPDPDTGRNHRHAWSAAAVREAIEIKQNETLKRAADAYYYKHGQKSETISEGKTVGAETSLGKVLEKLPEGIKKILPDVANGKIEGHGSQTVSVTGKLPEEIYEQAMREGESEAKANPAKVVPPDIDFYEDEPVGYGDDGKTYKNEDYKPKEDAKPKADPKPKDERKPKSETNPKAEAKAKDETKTKAEPKKAEIKKPDEKSSTISGPDDLNAMSLDSYWAGCVAREAQYLSTFTYEGEYKSESALRKEAESQLAHGECNAAILGKDFCRRFEARFYSTEEPALDHSLKESEKTKGIIELNKHGTTTFENPMYDNIGPFDKGKTQDPSHPFNKPNPDGPGTPPSPLRTPDPNTPNVSPLTEP